MKPYVLYLRSFGAYVVKQENETSHFILTPEGLLDTPDPKKSSLFLIPIPFSPEYLETKAQPQPWPVPVDPVTANLSRHEIQPRENAHLELIVLKYIARGKRYTSLR